LTDFYTIGLPRTRSMWLSKLLSCGDSTCFHEHLSSHEDQDKPEVSTRYRGFCDTNPLIAVDYGNAPVLIIRRDLESVIASAMQCFDPPEGVNSFIDFLNNYAFVYQSALDDLKPENYMIVEYEEINNKAEEICQFLMPENAVPESHIETMIGTRIQTTNRNLTNNLKHTANALGIPYKEYISQFDKPTYTCKRIYDVGLIINTMNLMWDEIAEDGAEKYAPNVIDEHWVAIYAGIEYIGMFRLHQHTSVLWQGHIFILPDQRHHARGVGKAMKSWIVDNLEGAEQMIASVPECFQNVIGFLKNNGFQSQGYTPSCYRKNGLIGLHQMGMSIEEMRNE